MASSSSSTPRTTACCASALVKRKGDVNLECTATQAKNGGVPSADAVAGWLEQLCDTLAVD